MWGVIYLIPQILWTAIIAALVVGIIAAIADWFVKKMALGIPNWIVWAIAFVVWLMWVFGGGPPRM